MFLSATSTWLLITSRDGGLHQLPGFPLFNFISFFTLWTICTTCFTLPYSLVILGSGKSEHLFSQTLQFCCYTEWEQGHPFNSKVRWNLWLKCLCSCNLSLVASQVAWSPDGAGLQRDGKRLAGRNVILSFQRELLVELLFGSMGQTIQWCTQCESRWTEFLKSSFLSLCAIVRHSVSHQKDTLWFFIFTKYYYKLKTISIKSL